MSQRKDLGLLMLRLAVGGTLFAHGSQKLFGWFGGGGLTGTGEAFEKMGFRPGGPNALAAGLGEAGCGALLVLGAATPAAGAGAAATMAAAASVSAPNGFFAQSGGLEHPALLGAAAASLAVTGPGRYAVDHATGHRLNRGWMPALALGALGLAAARVISKRQWTLEADRARERAEARGAENEVAV